MKTGLGLTAIGLVHLALAWDVARQKTPTLDEIAHVPAGISYLDKGTFKMYRFSPPLARLLVGLAAKTAHPNTDYDGTWRIHNPPNHWLFAFRFLLANVDDPARYLLAFERGRLVVAIWSALTIPLVYWWGSEWFGRLAGWLAAILWGLSPNIIAHAGLATTDLASASTTLLATWTFARWLLRPTWQRTGLCGAALGLAQLVKFSALLLYLILPIWALLYWLGMWRGRRSVPHPATPDAPSERRANEPGAKPRLGSPADVSRRNGPSQLTATNVSLATAAWLLASRYVIIVASSILTIDLGYGLEGVGRPLGDFSFVSQGLTRPRTAADGDVAADFGSSRAYNDVFTERVNRFRGTLLARMPCPLPRHYVAGFDEQKFESEGGYQMYLRGTLRRSGWWFYYLYALAVKVPVSTWLLLGLAVVGSRRNSIHQVRKAAVAGEVPALDQCPSRTPGRHLVLWWLISAPLLSMSLLTDINLGLRYVLPTLPFLFLLAGSAAAACESRWWKLLVGLCIVWNAVAIVRIHPHQLSYFNELAGGPANGRFHLIDSNLDWGQDLRGLARWLERNPDWHDVRLAYLGTVPPEFEGIGNYRLAPRDVRRVPPELLWPGEDPADPATFGPQPGRYGISVNFERGMQFHTPCPFAFMARVTARHPRAFQPAAPMLFNPHGVYSYFQHLTPRIEPEIGYSILLYEISNEEADRVRQIMGLPPLGLENRASER